MMYMEGFTQTISKELGATLDVLSAIQQSICTLQERSSRLSSGLANRLDVKKELENILGAILISDSVKGVIIDNVVGEEYQKTIIALDELMERAASLQKQGVKAAGEVLATGGALLRQAQAKTFAFFMIKLKLLGTEVSNLGVLQRAIYSPLHELYKLLKKYDQAKAIAFQKEYIAIAKEHYYSRYADAVKQFDLKNAIPLQPSQLIGDLRQPTAFSKLTQTLKNAFITTEPKVETTVVTRSSLVEAFYAVAQVLVDMISHESSFVKTFFEFALDEDEGISDEKDGHCLLIRQIFQRPLSSFKRRLQEKSLISANFGELWCLLVKLQSFLETSCMKPVSDVLINKCEQLILEQVKSLDLALNKMEVTLSISVATRRFATFILDAILLIDTNQTAKESLAILQPLVQAMDKFQSRSATLLVNARSQSVYMINNYDYLVNFMESQCEKGINPVYFTELIEAYEEKLNMIVNGFVMDELGPYFSILLKFLEQHELGHVPDNPNAVIVDFNENVKARIKSINASIIQLFSSYRTAVFVTNVIYSQLLTAYKNFIEIHDQIVGKLPMAESDTPVPMSVIDLERLLRK